MTDTARGFSNLSAAGIILRAALIQKMKAISAKKNIFLTAPGGYGKTVAAMQWLASVRGRTAKMIARSEDNDPGFRYMRLATALLRLTEQEKNIPVQPGAGISFDRLLEIVRMLPEKKPRRYLVIDDLHMIKNEEILNNMPIITTRLPGYICRCLVSRSEPMAPLLETGLFEVITKDELLFSPEEVEALSVEKAHGLSPEQINELLETTGGWAMYVSALLSDSGALEEKRPGKPPQTLTQYLEARAWGLWDRETKALLLSLAVPTEVTPPLCERLTGQTRGRDVLDRLNQKDNAFLSLVGDDTYRFHDIFRDFLLERMNIFLSKDEIRRLNDVAADWYYEQGNYYAGARHYIKNGDHEGINRCMEATNRYHEETGNLSVEGRLNFIKQYVMNLNPEFISENPYLISKCTAVAYHSGETKEFLHYLAMLNQKLPQIADKHPSLVHTAGYVNGLDFRIPYLDYIKYLARLISRAREAGRPLTGTRTATVTQNLPFFHRSLRDFSELYALRKEDLTLIYEVNSVMLGKDCHVVQETIITGMLYEQGKLLEAAARSINAYLACTDELHPETIFCAYMMLSAVLYAMGASQEAHKIMERTEDFIERKALFLRPNFKALHTERAIRDGDTGAAREWLTVYANRSSRLPFYQICRHFTTLRAFIALEDYAAAVAFGTRLLTLATEYNRPLDQIESGLLTAIALWHNGEKSKAVTQFEQTVSIAMPYNFIQLFINEGNEALPLLWELREKAGKSTDSAFWVDFVDSLTLDIYKTFTTKNINSNRKHKFKPANKTKPELTARRLDILSYLSKGMTYQEIADATGTGRATIKTHVLLMYKRLGVKNAQEALVKAKMLGLLE